MSLRIYVPNHNGSEWSFRNLPQISLLRSRQNAVSTPVFIRRSATQETTWNRVWNKLAQFLRAGPRIQESVPEEVDQSWNSSLDLLGALFPATALL